MLIEKVERMIRDHGMISADDRVIVGVSGGADSVCLFHVLLKLRNTFRFTLHAVHVHHSIRGEEADRDAEFVRAMCEECGVPFEIRKYDAPSYAAERGLSLEEAGRILRREAFASCAEKIGGAKIALAHHMNDVAETVLFNLARGSGIPGLASLRPVRGPYIRPLLNLEREEIIGWLSENGIAYCTDSTNADNAYSRNCIRNRILPELQTGVNRQSVRHICQISEEAREAEEFLLTCTEKCLEKYTVSGSENEVILSRKLFSEEKSYLSARAVKQVLGRLSGSMKDIERVHVSQVCGLAGKENGKRVDLPYGLRAETVYDEIYIRRVPHETGSTECVISAGLLPFKDAESCMPASGSDRIVCFDRIRVRVEIEDLHGGCTAPDLSDAGKTENMCTKKFDYDKINGILKIRYRMPGDYLVIHPDGRRKSLSDYFTDSKIPRTERDRIPLIACGSEILWVIGYRTGESCRIGSGTGRVLTLSVSE